MVDYVSEFESILIRDYLLSTIKKRKNINTSLDFRNEKNKSIKKYYLNDNLPNEISVDKDTKFHVFDVDDIDWKEAEKEIFFALDWADLKVGTTNEMENVVRTLVSMSSKMDTLTWLNELYLTHNKNVLFLCTLFHTLSHMEYEEVFPIGPTMAMGSLNHEDDRVIGYAIKAFANWNSKKTVELMKTNIPNIPWAKKEWNRVVEYIEKNGDDNYELFNKNDQLHERVDTTTR